MKVPLLDLQAQLACVRGEIDEAIVRVIERGNFIMGEEVEAWESEWAAFCGAKYAVGVSSGTDALYLVLKALDAMDRARGIDNVGWVATTPFTFFATTQAIVHAGLRPFFVDVEPDGNIDLSKVSTGKFDLALPVHLYGRPAPIPENQPRPIIEDAAQAHGLPLRGMAACHSFYPSKNLGAYGQAGAVVTNDEDLAKRVRGLRVYGEGKRFVHYALTGNHRMDELQAAILRAKLPHLNRWNSARRAVAALYTHLLNDVAGIVVPPDHPQHVYHIMAIRVTDPRGRDALARFLAERGVETAVRYPVPLHLQPALSLWGYQQGDFPNAERWAREVLTLPIYPEMRGEMVEYVAQGVRRWLRSRTG